MSHCTMQHKSSLQRCHLPELLPRQSKKAAFAELRMLFDGEDALGVEEHMVQAGIAEGVALGRALGVEQGRRLGEDHGWDLGSEV